MKKALIVFLATVILGCFAFTGCGIGTEQYAWVLAHSSSQDTVTQLYSLKFAEEVERLSDGKMRIQVYPDGSLGGDTELLESCEIGDIPFVVQNTAPQVSYMPQLALFDLPFVYQDIGDVRAVLDNEVFMKEINAIYEKGGFRLLGMADQHFRVMSSNKKVESLGDFKGIKIRTMENSNHITSWKDLGSNPTPMTFSEVYIGLQQGTIDAQENPYEVIVSSKLYEAQDYVIQTNHLPHLISLVVSDRFFGKLSEDEQKIIQEAADIAKDYAREQAEARADERMQIIADNNTEIVPLSEELWAEMQEATSGVYDSIRKVVNNDELFDTYIGAK